VNTRVLGRTAALQFVLDNEAVAVVICRHESDPEEDLSLEN